MSAFTRYKKNPEGLRQLVELWESTPLVRRQKMIDAGMKEDPEYTQKALSLVMTFDDIVNMPDLELAEILASTPPVVVGQAIHQSPKPVIERFLSKVLLPIGHQIKEVLGEPAPNPAIIEAAQIKLVLTARKFERADVIGIKRIPLQR